MVDFLQKDSTITGASKPFIGRIKEREEEKVDLIQLENEGKVEEEELRE